MRVYFCMHMVKNLVLTQPTNDCKCPSHAEQCDLNKMLYGSFWIIQFLYDWGAKVPFDVITFYDYIWLHFRFVTFESNYYF